MANPIDIVISKEALAEIDKAISKIGALDKEIQSTAQSFISNSKKMASALSSITPVDVISCLLIFNQTTTMRKRQAFRQKISCLLIFNQTTTMLMRL